MNASVPPMPGAVGLTHLKVYNSVAPDGLRGGSPHVHLVCTEAYYVLAGQGAVQTLSSAGYTETSLEPGALVWFSPGVIHRLVNGDGNLEILVVMQNAGLPEAGDFVLTFAPSLLQAPDRYLEAASLSSRGEVYAGSEDAARRRRDLAVEGFHELLRQVESGDMEALERFYSAAAALVRGKLDQWTSIWEAGPDAATRTTLDQLTALQQGDTSHLQRGTLAQLPPASPPRRLGVCGTLGVYLPEGAVQPLQQASEPTLGTGDIRETSR